MPTILVLSDIGSVLVTTVALISGTSAMEGTIVVITLTRTLHTAAASQVHSPVQMLDASRSGTLNTLIL